MRSSATFSSRRSARSCWTRESAGCPAGAFDIAAETGLELAQAQVLHLSPQVARLALQARDAPQVLERKAIQLAGVDQQADLQHLAFLLQDFLVAGHGSPGDLNLREAADPAHEDVNRA